MNRPRLEQVLDSKTFRSFYYLKEELVDFCRKNELPVSGSKLELTERIAVFLDTGKVVASTRISQKSTPDIGDLTEKTIIEDNFVCSEKHRAFFEERIGNRFSFNVLFQKWLKDHAGKTYGDAIKTYYQILEEKKKARQQSINNLNIMPTFGISLKIIKERVLMRLLYAGNIKKDYRVTIVMSIQI